MHDMVAADPVLEDVTFVGLLRRERHRAPARVYAVFEGQPITFGDLDARSDAFATCLREELALAPGERVAVMMGNSTEALGVVFGIAKAGLVWVPVNARQRGESLRYILEDSGARVIVADGDLVATITACGRDLDGIAVIAGGGPGSGGVLADLLRPAGNYDGAFPEPASLCALMYTSGTTGPPKGVCVTYRMMEYAARSVGRLTEVRRGDVFFQWEPLYHIGGAQMMLLPLFFDASLAMVGRFSASRFWEQVTRAGATHIHYLGGVLQMLLKQRASPLERRHRVRMAWGGGCQPATWRSFEKRFRIPIRECYGMTEAASVTTYNADGLVGSVGRPVPWFDVRIAGEDGTTLGPAGVGEIVVREKRPGALFPGYFGKPEATREALKGGELWTGDRGRLDAEGHLYFLGRLTDSVRRNGENVSAWEVEHVAGQHPGVAECAMVGVAATVGEQEIKLFVRPAPGTVYDPAELSRWLESRLAPHQNPRYISAIDAFEHTPSRRIIKRHLSRATDNCWDRLREGDDASR